MSDSYAYYTQYPQHQYYAPEAATTAASTASETIAPATVEKPTTYRAREIAEKYNLGYTADRVGNLEDAFKEINTRLDTVGNQLKDLGRDPLKFKANHMDNLMIDPDRPLSEIYKGMEHQEKLATKEVKEALLAEMKAKKAVKKAEEENKYINNEFEKLLYNQQKSQQTQAHTFKAHKPYNHSYSNHVEYKFTADVAKTAAAVAFFGANTFFGGIANAFLAFNLFRFIGL